MHPNIKALRQALSESKIPFTQIAGFPDALFVGGDSFIRATTPFNSESVSALCRDKDAVQRLFETKVKMPRTKGFVDPKGKYPELASYKSIQEIVTAASDFLYPRIIKMNQGEQGRNVFVSQNDKETILALTHIFDKTSRDYDYIALVQEFVEVKKEFRVVVSARKPCLVYDRASYAAVTKDVSDEMMKMSKTILKDLHLEWGSLDFIESKRGEVYFIEANTKPSFEGFIEKNGNQIIIEIYKQALKNCKIS